MTEVREKVSYNTTFQKIMTTRLHSIFVLVIAVGLFPGCGGNVKVTGHVQFDDKTPLTVGEVIFESDTLQARGLIDRSGNFAIGTTKDGDGIPRGEYRVYISGASEPTGQFLVADPREPRGTRADPTRGGREIMRSIIDDKYTRPHTSDLVCNVTGTTVFNITVSRPQ